MSISIQADALASAEPVITDDEMYRLGLVASTGGDGDSLDLITAHKWFNLAAMRGNAAARAYRAELAREMTSDQIAEAQRLAREYLASRAPVYNS